MGMQNVANRAGMRAREASADPKAGIQYRFEKSIQNAEIQGPATPLLVGTLCLRTK